MRCNVAGREHLGVHHSPKLRWSSSVCLFGQCLMLSSFALHLRQPVYHGPSRGVSDANTVIQRSMNECNGCYTLQATCQSCPCLLTALALKIIRDIKAIAPPAADVDTSRATTTVPVQAKLKTSRQSAIREPLKYSGSLDE